MPQEAEYYSTALHSGNFFQHQPSSWISQQDEYTHSSPPPEDIGVQCQQEEFDLEFLAEKLQKDPTTSELHMEELERIPLVKKIAVPADIMDLEETECKIRQYCQIWKLYAEISVELKRKSELS